MLNVKKKFMSQFNNSCQREKLSVTVAIVYNSLVGWDRKLHVILHTGGTGWWWWYSSAQVRIGRSWKYKVISGLINSWGHPSYSTVIAVMRDIVS